MKDIIYEALEMWAEEYGEDISIRDFVEEGLLTDNDGLVVEIEDEGKFQLTIVQE